MVSTFIIIVSIPIGVWIGWSFSAGPLLVACVLAFTLSTLCGELAGDAVPEIIRQATLLCAALEIAALLGVAVRLLTTDRRRTAGHAPRTHRPV